MKQRIISFLLAVLMTATILPVQAWGATVVDSGTCGGEGDGSNLTWTLDSDGLLTIDGKGEMSNWNSGSSVPWYANRSKIKCVVIGNGVTSIGDYAFCGCSSLTRITIPDSVTWIGRYAFSGCSSLISITIPDSVTSIGGSAFSGCYSLTDVYYGGNEAQWQAISIDIYNSPLTPATIHYNSTGPQSGQNSSIYSANPGELALAVYENRLGSSERKTDYQLSRNAKVSAGSASGTTNEQGQVSLAYTGGAMKAAISSPTTAPTKLCAAPCPARAGARRAYCTPV